METKISKQKRENMINNIVDDCIDSYEYRDFAADCVREVVSNWSDEELRRWFEEE